MQRSHTTRPLGGVLIVVLALLASLVLGSVGAVARADDPAPTPTPTDPASPATGGAVTGGTTSPSAAAGSPTGTPSSLARQLLGPGPVAVPERWVVRRGYTTQLNVAGNDTCGPGRTCHYTKVSAPIGWTVTVGATGVVSIKVPKKAIPHQYAVNYRLTDDLGHFADAYVAVAVTPDSFSAPSGMTFSHPYRKGYRYKIHDKIIRAINSVPTGARIQIASWSFSSKSYRQALRDAKRRGAIVQIVLAARNTAANSDYRLLKKIFGTSVTPNGNWVRKCSFSCRGRGAGTMHAKIFLFSQVYRTPYVIMTGSANFTDFAVTNQWNQMNTVRGSGAIYAEGVRVFTQMSADRPVLPTPYVESHYPTMWSYYYPRGAVSPDNDFMLKALAPVQCTGAINAAKGGRTIIKIAMYAWYQDRGKWLAKRVRQLWQQGCQIQIVYAISSDPVKKILYSPAGRGRIPMRQILLTNKDFEPIYYLHDKWVAITGHYGSSRNASVSLQGSFNFSDLGFYSDENFQKVFGRSYYNQFARDFTLLWRDKQARAPSPMSTIPTVTGRYTSNDLRLGTGVYRYMEAD